MLNHRPERSRPLLVALILTLTAMAELVVFAAPAAAADAEAKAVAERTLKAMGGAEAWEETRFLRFNFFGARLHHWDRYTGRHRVEGTSREGVSYVVLHNINSREGEVYLDGALQSGESAASWLERAYGAWINDTYWLLMPYKLQDPGVNLRYDGEETIDGTLYDKLQLSFGEVGLTPGDRYWAYINRDSGLMDRWAYHLQDWEAEREPTRWTWSGWAPHGQIMLASKRTNLADGSERELGELAVFDSLPDAVFTSPEPVEQ